MRPPQNNKRTRGRNSNNTSHNSSRRGPNPLTRSYESNGPDTKVRGTAAHVAEKYVQLARDAHVAGDPVTAESYLQHAEHYFRIIAAAQLALNPPPRPAEGLPSVEISSDETDDEDFDGGINDRFTYRSPQSYQAPQAGQPFTSNGFNAETGEENIVSQNNEQPNMDVQYDHRSAEPRYQSRPESRNGNDGRNSSRFDGRNGRDRNERQQRNDFARNDYQRNDYNRQESPRQEFSRQETSRQETPRHESSRHESSRQESPRTELPRNELPRNELPRNELPRNFENSQQDGNRFEQPRRERPFRQDRNQDRNQDRGQDRGQEKNQDRAYERSFEPKMDRSLNDRSTYERPQNDRSINDRPSRSFQPEIADVQPILPSFITAPVIASPPRLAPAVEIPQVQAEPVAKNQSVIDEVVVPKVRRRRAVKVVEPSAD